MAKILSKYTKSKSLVEEVEYTSQLDYAKAVSNNFKLKPPGDLDQPYTFRQWYNTRTGIIPGQEYIQYNEYLKKWYDAKKTNGILTDIPTRELYLDFLNEIQSLFDDKLPSSVFTEDQVEYIIERIPEYAQKIKDIARYIIFKREAIKKAKLKYNMAGTNQSLERLFYEYILKAFTRNKDKNEYTVITDANILRELPDLSASQNLKITIEDYYDDTSYMDRDPSLPTSQYFTYTPASSAFLVDYNITTQDEFEWLYNTGVSQLCADNPLLWTVDEVLRQYQDGIPLSAIDDSISNTLNDYNRIFLARKYLGEQQYIISGGYYVEPSAISVQNLSAGNNWFYWPRGTIITNVPTEIFQNVPLSASSLIIDGATPNMTYDNSDVIFVRTNTSFKGAWLQSQSSVTTPVDMNATLKALAVTRFIYPFPGYGLSSEDFEWTGRDYKSTEGFEFLDKKLQKAVFNEYWKNTSLEDTTIDSLNIHKTTLISSKARPGKNIIDADLIVVKPNIDYSANNYTQPLCAAWLYKIDSTDLLVDHGDNNFIWPYERYDTDPISLDVIDFTNVCNPISLSSIYTDKFPGAVSARSFLNPETNQVQADTVYILNDQQNPVQAAWLSGNKFIKLEKNIEDMWVSTDTPTDIVINAGDRVTYYHPPTRNVYYTTTDTVTSQLVNNNDSSNIWVNFSNVITGTDISLTWPSRVSSPSSSQVPPIELHDLYQITYIIKSPSGIINRHTRTNPPNIIFRPMEVGTYSFSAIGIKKEEVQLPFIVSESGGSNSGSYTYDGDNEVAGDYEITFNSTVTTTNDQTFTTNTTSFFFTNIPDVTARRTNIQTNSVLIENLSTTPSQPFIFDNPLYGWNYTTKKFDGFSRGARPVWVEGYANPSPGIPYKGYDIWIDNIRYVNNVQITQPQISQLSLSANMHIEYHSKNVNDVTWNEQISETVTQKIPQWKKLTFNTESILNDVNIPVDQLNVIATNDPSDIVFKTNSTDPQYINYYARNPFSWKQLLINEELGHPPTGGIWVPITSQLLVDPDVPYANLSNRHHPTYATIPYIDNMYTEKESGGYMTPQKLGISTTLTKNNINQFDTINKLGRIFQNFNIYNEDQGLSKQVQNTPVITTETDSEWMKSQFIEGYRAGVIRDPSIYQEMVPYQTIYESDSRNRSGVLQQHDIESRFEAVFKNLSDKELYQWNTDIFGTQYSMYKPIESTIFDRSQLAQGEIWVRTINGKFNSLIESAPSVFTTFMSYSTAVSNAVSNDKDILATTLKSFNVFYDTIFIETSHHLFIGKMSIDPTTSDLYTTADDSHVVSLLGDNKIYGGHWFFAEDKKVVFCVLAYCPKTLTKQIKPVLYELDLDTGVLKIIYNKEDEKTNFWYPIKFVDIDPPVLTYDAENTCFNASFIFRVSGIEGMYICSINICKGSNNYYIKSTKILEPSQECNT